MSKLNAFFDKNATKITEKDVDQLRNMMSNAQTKAKEDAYKVRTDFNEGLKYTSLPSLGEVAKKNRATSNAMNMLNNGASIDLNMNKPSYNDRFANTMPMNNITAETTMRNNAINNDINTIRQGKYDAQDVQLVADKYGLPYDAIKSRVADVEAKEKEAKKDATWKKISDEDKMMIDDAINRTDYLSGNNRNRVFDKVLNDNMKVLKDKYNLTDDEVKDFELSYKYYRRNAVQAERDEKARDFANEHPVLGTASSFGNTALQPLEGIGNTLAGLVTDDERWLDHEQLKRKNAKREGAKENLDTVFGQTAYDLGTGLGDMGVASLEAGALGLHPATLMAMNTADRAQYEALQNGSDTRKASAYGTVAGLADYAFNKVGLDKIKESINVDTIKTGTDLLRNMGGGFLAEGGENVLQDIVESVADNLINGEKSNLQVAYADYIDNGATPSQAFAQTALDYAKQLGMSGVTGGLFGATFAGAKGIPELATNKLGDRINTNFNNSFTANDVNDVNAVPKLNIQNNNSIFSDNFGSKVLDAKNRAREFIQKAISNKGATGENYNTIKLFEAPDEMVEMVKRASNGTIDISNKQFALEGSKVYHELARHGNAEIEASRGQLPLTPLDIEKAVEGMAKPDIIENISNKLKGEQRNRFALVKEDGGYIVVVEAVGGKKNPTIVPEEIIKCTPKKMEAILNNEKSIAEVLYENSGDNVIDVGNPVEDIKKRVTAVPKSDINIDSGSTSETGLRSPLETNINPSETNVNTNKVMAEDIGINPKTKLEEDLSDSDIIDSIEEDFSVAGNPSDRNVAPSRGITNTIRNNELQRNVSNNYLKTIDNHEVKHERDTLNNAMNSIENEADSDRYIRDYANGTKNVAGSAEDIDRAMLLMSDLDFRADMAKDNVERTRLLANKMRLLSKFSEGTTNVGQTLQALRKWNRTSIGAVANGTKLLNDRVDKWKTQNSKKAEINGKLAKALSDMGNKFAYAEKVKTPKTRDEIKNQIVNTLKKEFGSVENKFDANAIEQITKFVYDDKIPTWQLTDEITHFLNHGEFYPITEDAEVKLKTSQKMNNILKRMGDDTRKLAKKAPTPKTIDELAEEIKNSFASESSSIDADFTDSDYRVLAEFVYNKVSNDVIEDEIRYKLNTGSWYTLDESTPVKLETNSKVANAFKKILTEETPKAEDTKATFNELREQIKNTVNTEYAGVIDNVSDSDIDFLAGLVSSGASSNEIADAINMKLATGTFGISESTQKRVSSIFEEISHYDVNSKQFVEGEMEAYRLIAQEVMPKASAFEKFNEWRFLAMLGNPKTMMRNFIGNKLFGGVTEVSDTIAALGEMGVDKLSKNGIERTKAILTRGDADLVNRATTDADETSYRQLAGTKYNDNGVKTDIERSRDVFENRLMKAYSNWVEDGNVNIKNKEFRIGGLSDYSSAKKKYGKALARYLKANGLNASVFDDEVRYKALLDDSRYKELNELSKEALLSNKQKAELDRFNKEISTYKEEMRTLEKARTEAIKQAEYAVFHEDNDFANAMNKLSKSSPLAHVIVEGLVPFKKTPANILRSGIDYSPLGTIGSVKKLFNALTDAKTDSDLIEYTNMLGQTKTRNRVNTADVIDSLSKNATGTALMLLGSYLYDKDVLISNNGDDKYQDQLEGLQNYSIRLGDYTATVDFLAPAIMPMLVGAEVMKTREKLGQSSEDFWSEKNIGKILNEGVNVSTSILQPIMDTSMLQGVSDTLAEVGKASKYDEDANPLGTLAMNAATGYISQALPTSLGQIARTIDNTRRSTYSDQEGVARTLDKQIKKTKNKIPFLSKTNEAFIDARGKEQKNGFDTGNKAVDFVGNALYQSLSPTYIDKVETTKEDEFAREVYEATKDASVFAPTRNNKSIPVYDENGNKIGTQKLDEQDMNVYARVAGETNDSLRKMLRKDDRVKDMSVEERKEVLKKINTLSDLVGEAKVNDKFSTTNGAYATYIDSDNNLDEVLNTIIDDAHKEVVSSELKLKGLEVNDITREMYENGETDRLDKYKSATEIAKEFERDGITKEQWNIYDKKGVKEFRKELTYEKAAKDNDVTDTKAFREAYDNHKVNSYVKAYNAITSTENGVDEFGEPKYLSYSDTTRAVFDEGGARALKEYVEASQLLEKLNMEKKDMTIMVKHDNIEFARNHNENTVRALADVENGGSKQAEWLPVLKSKRLNTNDAYDIIMTMIGGEDKLPKDCQGLSKQQIVQFYYNRQFDKDGNVIKTKKGSKSTSKKMEVPHYQKKTVPTLNKKKK